MAGKFCPFCENDTYRSWSSNNGGTYEEFGEACSSCGFFYEFSYGSYRALVPFPDHSKSWMWSYNTKDDITAEVEAAINVAKSAWSQTEVKPSRNEGVTYPDGIEVPF